MPALNLTMTASPYKYDTTTDGGVLTDKDGTVVVTSKEAGLSTCNLPGIDDPRRVMDLIWHNARAERDSTAPLICLRTVQ